MQDDGLGFVQDNQIQPDNDIGFVPENYNVPLSTNNKLSNNAWNNGLGAVVLGLTKMGGNLIGDAGTALTKAGAKHLGSFLQARGNIGANATPQQFGIQNPGIGTDIISGLTQASPYVAALPESLTSEALAEAPYVGKLLSKPVQAAAQSGALFGATQSDPGNALSGSLKDAAISAGIAQIPSYVGVMSGAGNELINALTNRNVKKGLGDAYNSIANNSSPKDLNNKVVNNILDNYTLHLNNSNLQYQDILNKAKQKGYALPEDQLNTFSNMIKNSNSALHQPYNESYKFITPSQQTADGLKTLLNDDNVKNLSSSLRDSIKNYLVNPTYKTAHNLQSDLGDHASAIKSSQNSTMGEKDTASLILGNKDNPGIRKNLVNDIYSNFNKYGDTDLSNSYGKATQYWKDNVLPYRSISQIRNAVMNNKPISNINNVLSNDDSKGYLDQIRSHMQQSPEQQSDLTANLLNKGAIRNSDNSYKVDPAKMTKIYNSLPSYIKDTLPKSTNDLLQNLSSLHEKNSSKLNIVKNLTKLGVGGVAAKKAIDYF